MATFVLHITVPDEHAVEMSNAILQTITNPGILAVMGTLPGKVDAELVYDPSRDPTNPAYIFRSPT